MGSMSARGIREQLGHPVIDADGHLLEFLPALQDAIRDEGGPGVVDRVFASVRSTDIGHDECVNGLWDLQSPEARARSRTRRPTWWAVPTRNTLDRATATFPGLLAERLDEFGIDFSVLFPTTGLAFPHMIDDEDDRRAACRGYNVCYSDAFDPFAHRMTPAALVTMHTPEEAVEALDHAVLECGLKAVLIPSYVSRPVPAFSEEYPGLDRVVRWLDTYGIDSVYDYDPFWQRCVDLGVSLSTHSTGFGWAWGGRRSISNFMYNHMGHFADAGEALCKSLFLGGVTSRFPQLRVGFLEGGVAWGARLFCDLLSHWDKRKVAALGDVDPLNLDVDAFLGLFQTHGGPWRQYVQDLETQDLQARQTADPNRSMLDEWLACGIHVREDIVGLFADAFSFGCEADDPMNAMAFSEHNPYGVRLRAMLGSDIGHWDVPDMSGVLVEAYELVEHGLISDADFRDLTFANAARFYADANPRFFEGTVLEGPVSDHALS